MKKLILKRIKELYEDYRNNDSLSMTLFTDEDLTKYALKVLVDIYTDNGIDDDRLIYHDWDVIEPTIELILEKEGNND